MHKKKLLFITALIILLGLFVLPFLKKKTSPKLASVDKVSNNVAVKEYHPMTVMEKLRDALFRYNGELEIEGSFDTTTRDYHLEWLKTTKGVDILDAHLQALKQTADSTFAKSPLVKSVSITTKAFAQTLRFVLPENRKREPIIYHKISYSTYKKAPWKKSTEDQLRFFAKTADSIWISKNLQVTYEMKLK